MIGKLRAARQATLPTAICVASKSDRTSLGCHAQMGHRQSHYATFNQFAEAILGFFRKILPDKWREFTDTVTDNFRIISLDQYKVI